MPRVKACNAPVDYSSIVPLHSVAKALQKHGTEASCKTFDNASRPEDAGSVTEMPITPGVKRILETFKNELHPITTTLKDVLVELQTIRISMQLYSAKLSIKEVQYSNILPQLYQTLRKLDEPDRLFEGLGLSAKDALSAYFQFKTVIQNEMQEALTYTELIDRTLDRKRQRVENNRTFVIAVLAIIISVVR